MKAAALSALLAGVAAAASVRGGSSAAAVDTSYYGVPRLGGSCKGTSFDFYELVTQWAITECSDGTFTCSADWAFFTLHGLWPQDADGDYPCNCGSQPFAPSSLAPIQADMDKFWPSLNGPGATFWAHEWDKHGTCASTFTSQLAFFNGTLALLKKYDIVAALGAAGIVPSNTKGFTKSAFGAALKAAFGATAEITCDAKGNISGATMCISKAGVAMACPSNVKPACSASTVYLPAQPYGAASPAQGQQRAAVA